MKSQKRVVLVLVDRTKVRMKDLPEDLFLLNLLHLLLQHLQHDHHLRKLAVFNQLHQHLLLQHQGNEYSALLVVQAIFSGVLQH